MRTQPLMIQAFKLELWPVNARKRVDSEYCTHLAVNFRSEVKIDQGKDYDREAGQARK